MKIVFNKLQTSKETIQVSLDGGSTYTPYVVSEIIETGIPLDENQEYDKIQIKGSSTVLKSLDVVKSINVNQGLENVKSMKIAVIGAVWMYAPGYYVYTTYIKVAYEGNLKLIKEILSTNGKSNFSYQDLRPTTTRIPYNANGSYNYDDLIDAVYIPSQSFHFNNELSSNGNTVLAEELPDTGEDFLNIIILGSSGEFEGSFSAYSVEGCTYNSEFLSYSQDSSGTVYEIKHNNSSMW